MPLPSDPRSLQTGDSRVFLKLHANRTYSRDELHEMTNRKYKDLRSLSAMIVQLSKNLSSIRKLEAKAEEDKRRIRETFSRIFPAGEVVGFAVYREWQWWTVKVIRQVKYTITDVMTFLKGTDPHIASVIRNVVIDGKLLSQPEVRDRIVEILDIAKELGYENLTDAVTVNVESGKFGQFLDIAGLTKSVFGEKVTLRVEVT